MHVLILLFLLFVSADGAAQNYLRANEKRIFSFQTQNGRQVFLVMDNSGKYMLYRFGSKSKIEFEYPSTTKDSWDKFMYTFYLKIGDELFD